jgi:hypothetical protein
MSSSLGNLDLVKSKLAPACVDIADLVLNNEGSDEGLTRMVSLLGRPCLQMWHRAVCSAPASSVCGAAVKSSSAACMRLEACATTAALGSWLGGGQDACFHRLWWM